MLAHAPRHFTAFAKPSQGARRLLAFLLVALVWLQFAGLVHKYAHPDQLAGSHHATAQLGQQAQLEKLLPEHSQQNKSDCQLFDLQCSGFALSQALSTLALPQFALHTASLEVAAVLHQPSLVYQARAPPKTSI